MKRLTIQLTDKEAALFRRFCREAHAWQGVIRTPRQILENFVADFLGSERTNGSDERDLAEQWYQRTHLGTQYRPRVPVRCAACGFESEWIDQGEFPRCPECRKPKIIKREPPAAEATSITPNL